MTCKKCKHCLKKTKHTHEDPKKKAELMRRNAALAYAMGSLWKRIAKDFEKLAQQ